MSALALRNQSASFVTKDKKKNASRVFKPPLKGKEKAASWYLKAEQTRVDAIVAIIWGIYFCSQTRTNEQKLQLFSLKTLFRVPAAIFQTAWSKIPLLLTQQVSYTQESAGIPSHRWGTLLTQVEMKSVAGQSGCADLNVYV